MSRNYNLLSLSLLIFTSISMGKTKFYQYPEIQFPNGVIAVAIHEKTWTQGGKIEIIEINLKTQKTKVINELFDAYGGVPIIYSEFNYNPEKLPPSELLNNNKIRMIDSYFSNSKIIVGMDYNYVPYDEKSLLFWVDEWIINSFQYKEVHKSTLMIYTISDNKYIPFYILPYEYSWIDCQRYNKKSNSLAICYSAKNKFETDQHIYISVVDLSKKEATYTIEKDINCFNREGLDWLFDSKLFCYVTYPKYVNNRKKFSIKIHETSNNNIDYNIISTKIGSYYNPRFIDNEWIVYIWNEGVDFFNDEELRIVSINTKEEYVLLSTKGEQNRYFSFDVYRP